MSVGVGTFDTRKQSSFPDVLSVILYTVVLVTRFAYERCVQFILVIKQRNITLFNIAMSELYQARHRI